MNRKKLKPGDEVVLVDTPATVWPTKKAATSKTDGYWVAKVMDPDTTYPGWGYREPAVKSILGPVIKTLPGVKVKITGYIPGERDDPATVKPYKPREIGNQPGGGTVIKVNHKGHEYVVRADDGTPQGHERKYLPGDTVTVGARLIVNTTTENERLLAAKKAARKAQEAKRAEEDAAGKALAARYAALGIETKQLGSTVKVETKPEALIEIIEALRLTLPPDNAETEEVYE